MYIGNIQIGREDSQEERYNLSPIQEESETMLCFKQVESSNFTINESEENDCKIIQSPYKEYRRISRRIESNRDVRFDRSIRKSDNTSLYGSDTLKDKSSDSTWKDNNPRNECFQSNYYELKRVKGSYCCFNSGSFIKGRKSPFNPSPMIKSLKSQKVLEWNILLIL